MNDAGIFLPEQFAANTQAMIGSIRRENPKVEFILLMSFPPNSRATSIPRPAIWKH